tara:strand:- start:474 stop:980 length:507 start_codon:yes stop_codon:yes gene_type:complete
MAAPANKQHMLDSRGRPLTQSLFLEVGYNTDTAIFTLKDWDWTLDGKEYKSLKQLYLEMEDPLEYHFATTYFLSWDHWLRICNNKMIKTHVDKWRVELELKLASASIRGIIDQSGDERGFQAAKYVAERAWNKKPVGRPRKDMEAEQELIDASLNDAFADDLKRLKAE